MSDCEHGGTKARHEPVGSVERVRVAGQPAAGEPSRVCDASALFPSPPSPRLFGEGSYGAGGPVAEGNYSLPDSNAQGGYGHFNDAGGYGATTLLGGETSEACEHKADTESGE